jgi:hypothetical protein
LEHHALKAWVARDMCSIALELAVFWAECPLNEHNLLQSANGSILSRADRLNFMLHCTVCLP